MRTLTLMRFPALRRPGPGTLLLAFTWWVLVVSLQLCWWAAKLIVIAVLAAASLVVGFVADRRARR